jgi:hypothetical protein
MMQNRIKKISLILVSLILFFSLASCASQDQSISKNSTITTTTITQTPKRLKTATQSPLITLTSTITISPTTTHIIVPTSSIDAQKSIDLSNHCRNIIDKMTALKKKLSLPDHFLSGEQYRLWADYNPNKYFNFLSHISMEKGYTLDYVYYLDDIGGKPVNYARRIDQPQYKTYIEYIGSLGVEVPDERSYMQLIHALDYLKEVIIDKTPESYLDFVTLALQGGQYYLYWHGLYSDIQILCDLSDTPGIISRISGITENLTQEFIDSITLIDYSPLLVIDESSVTIRFVTFSQWGGFFENIYTMEKGNPNHILDMKFYPILKYDSGISF